jgi:NADPH:quinone reductase-like Zn-dependent oxidoreductase
MLAAIPEGLIFEEAAPGSEGSHYALSSVRAAKVRRGRDVLVYGATGAIGSAAVQLLKQVGATSRLPARRATRVPYRRVNHGYRAGNHGHCHPTAELAASRSTRTNASREYA